MAYSAIQDASGPITMELDQSDEKDKGPICFRSIISWRFKDAEGRGVGRAPSRGCGDGRELHQGLCYKQCNAGWKGVGALCFYVGFN
ncbi:hypothetical protein BKA69DRAFT_1128671 [Paraphysoderma sedebokerense]|nr:hypothetical protein BKA69DRAFT_1128671 [Paraphysoderma sedebokerense]